MLACLSIAETPKPRNPETPKRKGIGRIKTGLAYFALGRNGLITVSSHSRKGPSIKSMQ
ncbi:hypothetical protein SHAL103562_05155 [Shewanella algae]